MLNKVIIFIAIFTLNFIWAVTCSLADDDLTAPKQCDGRDPNGGVLVPENIVMRCGLCIEKELEFNDDCVQRLSYDSKADAVQYRDTVQKMISAYVPSNMNYATNRITETGTNDADAKIFAGYENPPSDYDKTGKLKDLCDRAKKEQKEDDSFEPTICMSYNKWKSRENEKAPIDECKEDGTSTRCYQSANGSLVAYNTELILSILGARSMLARSEVINNIVNQIIPENDVDTTNIKLKFATDEEAEAAIAKLQSEQSEQNEGTGQ